MAPSTTPVVAHLPPNGRTPRSVQKRKIVVDELDIDDDLARKRSRRNTKYRTRSLNRRQSRLLVRGEKIKAKDEELKQRFDQLRSQRQRLRSLDDSFDVLSTTPRRFRDLAAKTKLEQAPRRRSVCSSDVSRVESTSSSSSSEYFMQVHSTPTHSSSGERGLRSLDASPILHRRATACGDDVRAELRRQAQEAGVTAPYVTMLRNGLQYTLC